MEFKNYDNQNIQAYVDEKFKKTSDKQYVVKSSTKYIDTLFVECQRIENGTISFPLLSIDISAYQKWLRGKNLDRLV